MQNQPAGWEVGDMIAGLALGLSLINLIVGVFVERYRRRRSISIEDAFLFPVGYTSDFCWLVVLATLVNNTHACLSFTNARLRLKDGEIKKRDQSPRTSLRGKEDRIGFPSDHHPGTRGGAGHIRLSVEKRNGFPHSPIRSVQE